MSVLYLIPLPSSTPCRLSCLRGASLSLDPGVRAADVSRVAEWKGCTLRNLESQFFHLQKISLFVWLQYLFFKKVALPRINKLRIVNEERIHFLLKIMD